MLIRFTRGTVWAGQDRVEGDILDVEPGYAKVLVEGYHAAEYVNGGPPPLTRWMMVNADPVVESRDPVPAPTKRRRR